MRCRISINLSYLEGSINSGKDFGIAYVNTSFGNLYRWENRLTESEEFLEEAVSILGNLFNDLENGEIHPSLSE